jgi:hypothetical protein
MFFGNVVAIPPYGMALLRSLFAASEKRAMRSGGRWNEGRGGDNSRVVWGFGKCYETCLPVHFMI